MLAAGILVTLINWLQSARRGALAGNDPWRGETLEWATTSPPPDYNFETVPTVRSLHPMWDQPELSAGPQRPEDGGHPLSGGHLTMSTSMLDGTPQALVHMPHESPWPLLLTVAMLTFFYGVLIDAYTVAALGAACSVVGLIGWFYPRGETQES